MAIANPWSAELAGRSGQWPPFGAITQTLHRHRRDRSSAARICFLVNYFEHPNTYRAAPATSVATHCLSIHRKRLADGYSGRCDGRLTVGSIPSQNWRYRPRAVRGVGIRRSTKRSLRPDLCHRLSGDLDAVSVWIEGNALVVAISGATGPVKNWVSISMKTLGQLVYALFGADGERQMR